MFVRGRGEEGLVPTDDGMVFKPLDIVMNREAIGMIAPISKMTSKPAWPLD